MEKLFLIVLQMGISFSALILAAVTAHFLLKRVSNNMICMLWMVVGLRLALPFEIVTDFSLLPETTGMVMEYVYPQTSVKNAEIAKVSKTQQMDVPLKKMGKDVPRERSAVQKVSTAAWIWMAGIAI